MKKLEIGLMAALLLFPAIGTAEAYTAETLKQAQGPAIVSESYKDGTMEVRKAVSKDTNLLRRARINSAIDTEIDRFGTYVAKANQRTGGGTKGWINYKEGMTGENDPYTSLLLFESVYYYHAAHPLTYAKGLTFDQMGHKVTFEDLKKKMPNLTLEELRRQTALQAEANHLFLFKDYKINKFPETFYIDKNNHLYFVFQQYAIAPYAAGFIVIDMGEVPEK